MSGKYSMEAYHDFLEWFRAKQDDLDRLNARDFAGTIRWMVKYAVLGETWYELDQVEGLHVSVVFHHSGIRFVFQREYEPSPYVPREDFLLAMREATERCDKTRVPYKRMKALFRDAILKKKKEHPDECPEYPFF